MSYASQHVEIKNRFKASWVAITPVAWSNEYFIPPFPQSAWVRFTIRDGKARQLNIGEPAIIRYAGMIYIQIFTKPERGDVVALSLADRAKRIFHNWTGEVVQCRAAKIYNLGEDRYGWYQVNVAVPFIREERF